MKAITFRKSRYHQHVEMEDWCQKHIGPGQWYYPSTDIWEKLGDSLWVIYGSFGNITFAFKEEKHYMLFLLRWS